MSRTKNKTMLKLVVVELLMLSVLLRGDDGKKSSSAPPTSQGISEVIPTMNLLCSVFSAIRRSVAITPVDKNIDTKRVNNSAKSEWQQPEIISENTNLNVKGRKKSKAVVMALVGLLGCFSFVLTTSIAASLAVPESYDVNSTVLTPDSIHDGTTSHEFLFSEIENVSSRSTSVVSESELSFLTKPSEIEAASIRGTDSVSNDIIANRDYFSEIDEIELVKSSEAGTILKLYTNTGH